MTAAVSRVQPADVAGPDKATHGATGDGHGHASPRTIEALPVSRNRADHLQICAWVTSNARVLDVGCGNGELLRLLTDRRSVRGRGLEISRSGVTQCLAGGLSVIQGDADHDLANYPDKAFEYAILSQTIQATHQPQVVLGHLLRIAERVIVSFPNFGHWRVRWQLAIWGRMPVTGSIPHQWYDTPNIHLCTVRDFHRLCDGMAARVERTAMFDEADRPLRPWLPTGTHNLLSASALFLLCSHRASR